MSTFTYWRHKTTGEIFAIRVNEDGVMDGVAGPIAPREALRERLPSWPYSDGTQLQRRMSEYTPLTTKQTRARRRKKG